MSPFPQLFTSKRIVCSRWNILGEIINVIDLQQLDSGNSCYLQIPRYTYHSVISNSAVFKDTSIKNTISFTKSQNSIDRNLYGDLRELTSTYQAKSIGQEKINENTLYEIGNGVFKSSSQIKSFDKSMISPLLVSAKSSKRKRSRICFHSDNNSELHEMIILLLTEPENLKITKVLMIATKENRRPYISHLPWEMRKKLAC